MSKTQAIWTGVKAPTVYEGMTFENSDVLHKYWQAEKQRLKDSGDFARVEAQLFRKLSIETGLIEGAYTIIEDENRGVTVALIEKGFHAAELSHQTTGDEDRTREILQAQYDAYVAHAMPVIKGERPFNEHFLKTAHVVIMGPNPTHKVPISNTNQMMNVRFESGTYKDFENFPMRKDGVKVLYCPPLQTPPQMEKLFEHYEEWKGRLHPIALATWFHHEFVKIHPFPDGNGRVARLMASTILIKAGFMPMNVDRLERPKYIKALDDANEGKVEAFAGFVDRAQWPLLADTSELAKPFKSTKSEPPTDGTIESAIARFSARKHATDNEIRATQPAADYAENIVHVFGSGHRRIVAQLSRASESLRGSTNKDRSNFYLAEIYSRACGEPPSNLINIGTWDYLLSEENSAGRVRVALAQLSPATPTVLILCTSLLFGVSEDSGWKHDSVDFLDPELGSENDRRVSSLSEAQFARLIDSLA